MRHGLMALTAIAVAFAPSAGNVVGLLAARAQQAAPPIVSPTAVPADTTFTRAELENLLKPIALFPDALLAQMLPSAAYPLDIVQASRWLDKNKDAVAKKDFTGADAQAWDPTVKAMVRFPDLIRKMNADLDWTSDLGDAFVYQPEDVATSFRCFAPSGKDRRARHDPAAEGGQADRSGARGHHHRALGSRSHLRAPVRPGTVYDLDRHGGRRRPADVRNRCRGGRAHQQQLLELGSGAAYPPRWGGYPGYGGRPGGINNGNINIGNDINIGGGSNVIGNSKPWSPDGTAIGRARVRSQASRIRGPAARAVSVDPEDLAGSAAWVAPAASLGSAAQAVWVAWAGPAASVAQAGSADLAELADWVVLQLAAQLAVQSVGRFPGRAKAALARTPGRARASVPMRAQVAPRRDLRLG